MVLGVVKDVWALLKPSGEGLLVFGFLMIRYSSLYRVWFGYAFTGAAAWYATVPHVLLYGAGIYGLITRRRWAWMLRGPSPKTMRSKEGRERVGLHAARLVI